MNWPPLAFPLSSVWGVWHTRQEVRGAGGPIWEYLADRYRWFPTLGAASGRAALFAFLALQVWFAFAGYVGGSPTALVALVVIRLGDCVVSHWLPWLRGGRPNPGLATTPLYLFDAGLAGAVLAGWLY